MDYNFETVPFQYLRADRRLFVNPEYLLQIEDVPDTSVTPGTSWYVDALVIEPGASSVFLCEFSFSKSLQGLKKRLSSWANYWPSIAPAIARDSALGFQPTVRPWAFVPEECTETLVRIAKQLGFDGAGNLPALKITTLEMTLPWRYRYWNRLGEADKPEAIPLAMR